MILQKLAWLYDDLASRSLVLQNVFGRVCGFDLDQTSTLRWTWRLEDPLSLGDLEDGHELRDGFDGFLNALGRRSSRTSACCPITVFGGSYASCRIGRWIRECLGEEREEHFIRGASWRVRRSKERILAHLAELRMPCSLMPRNIIFDVSQMKNEGHYL